MTRRLKGTTGPVARICCADDVQEGLRFLPSSKKAIDPLPGSTCEGVTRRQCIGSCDVIPGATDALYRRREVGCFFQAQREKLVLMKPIHKQSEKDAGQPVWAFKTSFSDSIFSLVENWSEHEFECAIHEHVLILTKHCLDFPINLSLNLKT